LSVVGGGAAGGSDITGYVGVCLGGIEPRCKAPRPATICEKAFQRSAHVIELAHLPPNPTNETLY